MARLEWPRIHAQLREHIRDSELRLGHWEQEARRRRAAIRLRWLPAAAPASSGPSQPEELIQPV